MRWWPTTRVALANYWTAGTAWAAMTALHWRWLWRSAHAGDVLSAYGAGVVALGVLIAARPFLRAGLDATVKAAMPHRLRRYMLTDEDPDFDRLIDLFIIVKVRDNVLAEKVVAVLVIVTGTMLNGWATPLARRWGLPV